jgi:CheY-like chemotaxis protein
MVDGHYDALERAFRNLMVNAMEAQGSRPAARVDVYVDGDDTSAVVRVEDRGPGVPPELLDEVWNPDVTTKRSGTGLGLAIVRQLVEMMQGELGIDGAPGKGSTFWFALPLKISNEVLKSTRTMQPSQMQDKLHGHILLVEDNPINQMVARKMLEKIGVETELAGDGQEALNLLYEHSFDAVLMDCQMPVLDGFNATRQLREWEQQQQRKPLPVIAMTANVMEGDRERCLDAGMNDYIGKPFRNEDLHAILQRWLQQ